MRVGASCEVAARGRFQIAEDTDVWWSEPQGVTIRYYGDRPLGELMFAVLGDNGSPAEEASFLQPLSVGERMTFTPATGGTLFFRVNDSNGELFDNRGRLQIAVRSQSP